VSYFLDNADCCRQNAHQSDEITVKENGEKVKKIKSSVCKGAYFDIKRELMSENWTQNSSLYARNGLSVSQQNLYLLVCIEQI
jgi:hypothetical protein